MVSVISFLRSLFGASKKSAILPPPPEYVQVCPQKFPEKAARISEPSYLNPNLQFTAQELEAYLAGKDASFAAAVVELMLPRLKLGVWLEPVGWGHYSYTLDKVLHSPCLLLKMLEKGSGMSLRCMSMQQGDRMGFYYWVQGMGVLEQVQTSRRIGKT